MQIYQHPLQSFYLLPNFTIPTNQLLLKLMKSAPNGRAGAVHLAVLYLLHYVHNCQQQSQYQPLLCCHGAIKLPVTLK